MATPRLHPWETAREEAERERQGDGPRARSIRVCASVPVFHGLCRDREGGTDTFEENSHVSLLLIGPTPDACPDLPRRGTLPVAEVLARAELGHFPLAVLVGSRRCSESPGQHWLPEQRIWPC